MAKSDLEKATQAKGSRAASKMISDPLAGNIRPVGVGLREGEITALDQIGVELGQLLDSEKPIARNSLIRIAVRRMIQDLRSGAMSYDDFGEFFDEQFPNYEVKTHHFLWNAHGVYAALLNMPQGLTQPFVIVVEGFKACLWLLQHGYQNTVALMGSSMTATQADLLRRMSSRVLLLLDNDKAGIEGTEKIGRWLSRSVDIYVGDLGDADQPDDLDARSLERVIASKRRYLEWRRTRSTKR